jgi:hypothetical protein
MAVMSLRSSVLMAGFATSIAELYCPGPESFQFDGGASWTGNGWTVQAGGGAHGLTSFNMLGGYMEFDLDNSGSQWGVNNNLYTISPDHPYTSYDDYCDGQGPDASSPKGIYCMELDIWEGNGNQNGATTLHTWFNHDGDCDQGGCASEFSGGGSMHFRVNWDENGFMHTSINGQENSNFSPYPSQNAIDNMRDTMSKVGVVFVSTQWTGWVPGAGSVKGDLDNSRFSVSNLKVNGQVLMGPEPAKCGSELAI